MTLWTKWPIDPFTMKQREPHHSFQLIPNRYLSVLAAIASVSLACFFLEDFLGYHSVGFILLFSILSISTRHSLGPTLFSAFLSALSWNYFFIPPRFTLHITATDDFMMLLSFFSLAVTCGYYSSTIQRQRFLLQSEKLRYHTQLEESLILKESEKLHQTLLNSVSHELRTPLTSILGSSSALLARVELESDVKLFIEDIHSSAEKLQELTQELLDMSRLSSGVMKPNFEIFELNDFIHQLLGKNDSLNRDHHIVIIDHEETTYVSGDEGLLEICLFNLIKNAISYSPAGSTIYINTSKDEKYGSVAVRDSGVGIQSGEEEKLFLPFHRTSAKKGDSFKSEGLGLGLSIAKSIIDLHGGEISIENRKDQSGTVAAIRIPLCTTDFTGLS